MTSKTLTLAHYQANLVDIIDIIYVRSANDINNPKIKFKPLFTHQIHNEDHFFGYYNLKIDIYLTAQSANYYVDISYEDKIEDQKYGLEPDNVGSILEPWFPDRIRKLCQFKDLIKKHESDYVFGTYINSSSTTDEDGRERKFCVVNCDIHDSRFKSFHNRFQTLMIMFIESANFIDLGDPNWTVLYLYRNCHIKGRPVHCPVGFCTIYKFTESIHNIARISQFFILPCFQRLGLGFFLLDTCYSFLREFMDLNEIRVEKPNELFTKLRNKVDASHIIRDPIFSRSNLFTNLSDYMLKHAQNKYKFTNEQTRKLYEILRLYHAQGDDEQYNAGLKEIRRRLFFENRKLSKRCVDLNEYDVDLEDIINSTSNHIYAKQTKYVKKIASTIKYLNKNFDTCSVNDISF